MKKKAKAVFAVIIVLCISLSFSIPAFAGLDGNYTSPIPTVYLRGQGSTLYADKNNTSSEHIEKINVPDGYVSDVAKTLAVPLAKGLMTGDWDDWVDAFVDGMIPLFEKQALDENGEASNGSGIYTSSGSANRRNADGNYNLNAYTPMFDWRLDPCVIADDIHTYIQQVKAATGASKVNLIGRSMGTNILLAYLAKYGSDDLENIVFYCASFYGMEIVGKSFSGKIALDPAALDRFANYYYNKKNIELSEEDDELLNTLLDVVSLSNTFHTMDLPAEKLEEIYEQVYASVYPQLLVKMYGSMPSFWALIGDEDFEDAKKAVFAGQEEKYAGLIQKIDNFHYNVLNEAENLLTAYEQKGLKIHIVAKYGIPMFPVIEGADVQSDMLSSVYSASFGATCSSITEELSDNYILAAQKNGLGKYISPDKKIDASSCLLPDNTWFLKNIDHRDMPDNINAIFDAIVNFDGYFTVFDDPAFPQYLLYTDENSELVPVTDENPGENSYTGTSVVKKLLNVLKYILTLIKDFIASITIKG